MKRLIALFSTLCLLTLSPALAKKLNVVTSFSILNDITETIGGERIQSKTIIGANQNAHTYEPTPYDFIDLKKADLFIINGLHFEGWLTRTVDASGFKGTLLDVSRSITPLPADPDHHHDHDDHDHTDHHDDHDGHASHDHHDHDHPHHDHEHGEFDPHIWQSPLNVIKMADAIKQELIALDPEGKAHYEANFEDYQKELLALDQWTRDSLKAKSNRAPHFLILHNSFQYFEHEYGVHFHTLMNSHFAGEPSAGDLAETMTLIKENNITTLFFENIEASRLLKNLMDDLKLNNGGILYSDALTKDDTANSYIKLFRRNVETMLNSID